MLTTKTILKNASEETGVPLEHVEEYYKAFLKGLEDRLEQETIITFKIKGLSYFNFSVPSFWRNAKRRTKKNKDKFRARKERARILFYKKLEEAEDGFARFRAKKGNQYYTQEPLYFYGKRLGYSVDEIYEQQKEIFEMQNTYNYEDTKNN